MDLKKANYLKASLTGLFRSGADDDHTPDEMEELLDGIDFSALLQAFQSLWQHVYEYQIESGSAKGFEYRGLELLPRNAVLLYTDEGCSFFDVATHERAYELWMLPDASFVVLSLVRTVIGDDESVMEYRSIKGGNWRETEMDIDFLDLSDDLEELCAAVRAHDLPLFEL